ncbi:hypothetical protein K469DRAFT_699987 [Zopfia rhizophila CBS 207.26]|uniref:Uncharacterized protein n=1 Tax=Zopfia rhizophila CBS 207.26 TaxID=1314779 RepID=A0A6A6DD83_9PEZI|nr:hypothetical protein K469DRAFT_699987 [Zopfia rhizophila CBS 207.26]
MGWGVGYRTYHVPLVRINLTQNIFNDIASMLQQVHERMDTLIGNPTDWLEVPIYDVMAKIVARVSNRAFSGTLLCELSSSSCGRSVL